MQRFRLGRKTAVKNSKLLSLSTPISCPACQLISLSPLYATAFKHCSGSRCEVGKATSDLVQLDARKWFQVSKGRTWEGGTKP